MLAGVASAAAVGVFVFAVIMWASYTGDDSDPAHGLAAGTAFLAGVSFILAAMGFASTRRSPIAALAYASNALLLAGPPFAFYLMVRGLS